MDFSLLKRDADMVKKGLFTTPSGQLGTKVPCKVIFPKYYLESNLGNVDSKINVIGIYAIVVGDKYAVSSAAAIVSFDPDEINVITHNGVAYTELSWDAGSVLMPNTNVVVNDKLAYTIYDEFVMKGKTPWYLNPIDMALLFDSLKEYAGVNLGAPHSILEIFTASRNRNPKDRARYAKELYKTQEEMATLETTLIPLRSVSYGATNTTSRLTGAYLSEGLNSALLNDVSQSEDIENLLRM